MSGRGKRPTRPESATDDYVISAEALIAAMEMVKSLKGEDHVPAEEVAEVVDRLGYQEFYRAFSAFVVGWLQFVEDPMDVVPALVRRLRRMDVGEGALPMVAGALTAAALGLSPADWRFQYGPVELPELAAWTVATAQLADLLDSHFGAVTPLTPLRHQAAREGWRRPTRLYSVAVNAAELRHQMRVRGLTGGGAGTPRQRVTSNHLARLERAPNPPGQAPSEQLTYGPSSSPILIGWPRLGLPGCYGWPFRSSRRLCCWRSMRWPAGGVRSSSHDMPTRPLASGGCGRWPASAYP